VADSALQRIVKTARTTPAMPTMPVTFGIAGTLLPEVPVIPGPTIIAKTSVAAAARFARQVDAIATLLLPADTMKYLQGSRITRLEISTRRLCL
jgi:hypothetical protein